MDTDKYMDGVRRTINYARDNSGRICNFSMGLSGEAGELIDGIKKHVFHGHELDIKHVKEEMGDVCWYLFALADTLGIDVGAVMENNLTKLKRRYPDGFDQERSINREA